MHAGEQLIAGEGVLAEVGAVDSPEDSELVNHLAKGIADVPEALLSLFQEVVSMRGTDTAPGPEGRHPFAGYHRRRLRVAPPPLCGRVPMRTLAPRSGRA